eukprot:COSAG06_NODE_8303_length_2207_cov_7929.583491_1_plen_58_part_10
MKKKCRWCISQRMQGRGLCSQFNSISSRQTVRVWRAPTGAEYQAALGAVPVAVALVHL